ncbi:MAG: DUF5681 domain-containing protein [Rickettsiales bacterium]
MFDDEEDDELFAVKTTKKQRGKQFEKGKSGNPSGRPKGSRNKTTMAMLELLEDEAEEITRTVIERAKAGDMMAIKLVMERICPPRKDLPVYFEIGSVKTIFDLIPAIDKLLQAISAGEISPQDAKVVSELIEQQRKTIVSTIPLTPMDDF